MHAAMSWRKHDLSKIIEQIPVGVAITLPDGTLEYANSHFCRLIEGRSDDIIGAPLARWLLVADAPPAGVVREAPHTGISSCGEARIRAGSGELRDILQTTYPLHDDAGTLTHFIYLLQDVSAQKQIENLSALAFYDSLTGLPNRNLFNDRLSRLIVGAERRCGAFSLLYIDIDHFKQINDTLGHEAGDELLRQIAARLAQSLRASDIAARWGGDEFVAILDGVASPQAAARIAHMLLTTCSEPYQLRDGAQCITLSIGVSLYPRDGQDVTTLLEHADRAMYKVKACGRNGYHVLEQPQPSYLGTV